MRHAILLYSLVGAALAFGAVAMPSDADASGTAQPPAHPQQQTQRGSIMPENRLHSGQALAFPDIAMAELERVGPERFAASEYRPGTIRHIVLFRYRDGLSQADIDQVTSRFLEMKRTALRRGKPYIVDIEAGTQMSGEGVDGGFQQAFIATFQSEGDRNYYVGAPIISDPAFFDATHQAFKDHVGPLLAPVNGVLVFDFRADPE